MVFNTLENFSFFSFICKVEESLNLLFHFLKRKFREKETRRKYHVSSMDHGAFFNTSNCTSQKTVAELIVKEGEIIHLSKQLKKILNLVLAASFHTQKSCRIFLCSLLYNL